jgi:ribonuclease BN (tRNA processing enzyme)
MSRRVVVLGGCGAWPEPGRACAGFLVEYDGFRVALDLGYGTLPACFRCWSVAADGLDAVVVTHDHPDQVVDLHGLFRARHYGARQGGRIALYAPEAVLERITDLEDGDRTAVQDVFLWRQLPAEAYDIGPFRLESPHYVPNAGVRLSAPELSVAYTGDTGPDRRVAEIGRAADLFIVDATDRYQQAETPGPPADRAMNMTWREAAEAAAGARAQRLMLTHFWPGSDRDRSVAEAAEVFAGEVLAADEGTVVDLR